MERNEREAEIKFGPFAHIAPVESMGSRVDTCLTVLENGGRLVIGGKFDVRIVQGMINRISDSKERWEKQKRLNRYSWKMKYGIEKRGITVDGVFTEFK